MSNEEIISVLNQNTPAHEHSSFSFDAARIRETWSHMQKNHATWFLFMQSWKADDGRVVRGVRRLRAGLFSRVAPTDGEVTYETLMKLWTAFVAPGPLVESLKAAGFEVLEGIPESEDEFEDESEIVTLPDIEFFNDAGDRVL